MTALRPQLLGALGVWGQDEEIIAFGRKLTESYLADPSSVHPSLATTALKLAAQKGDAALYETFRGRFESSKVPTDRSRYLAALASFRDPALVDRSLAYVFTGPLRPQETMSIPRELAESPEGKDKAFAWMTANYDKIAQKISPEFLVYMPYFAMGCSERRLDAAKTFFSDAHHAPPGTAVELAKVEESVTDCARLSTREGGSVRRYLAAP